MNKQQLELYVQKGYDQAHTNKRLSLILLLNRIASTHFNDARDYLKSFGLDIHDFKQDLNKIEKAVEAVSDKIKPLVTDPNQTIDFFKDYEILEAHINKFANIDN